MANPKVEDLRVRCTASAWVTDFDPLPYPNSSNIRLRASYVSVNWDRLSGQLIQWRVASVSVTGVLISDTYSSSYRMSETTYVYTVDQIKNTWLSDLVWLWSPARVVVSDEGESSSGSEVV